MSWLSELVADGFHEVLMFGDASGTTATDSSGNSRNGSYVGTPTLGAASLLANDATTSVDFNGTSQYVDVTFGSWMDVTNISLVCRKRFDDAPGTIEMLACRYPSTAAQRIFQWNRQASGVMGLAWLDSGGTLRSLVGSTTLAANTDYTLGVTITAAGVATLYVNGVSDGTFSTPGSLSMRTSSPIGMRVGAYHNGVASLFTDGRMQGFGYGPSVSAARMLVYHQVATSQTLALGQATETDSAQTLAAVNVGQIITLGLATETDSASAATVTSGTIVSLGLAAEADTTAAITVSQVVSLGLASETDAALGATAVSIVTLGFATEADTALAAAVRQTVTLGLAAEADSALGVTVSGGVTFVALGYATEVNSALSVAIVYGYTVTDTSNRAGGRVRSGLGITSFDPPLVELPLNMVRGVSYPIAQAISGNSMVGNQAHFDVATARGVQTRLQILYGNRDITYLFGIPTPKPEFQRATPFDFGPSTLRLPQFATPHEIIGEGRWSFLLPNDPESKKVKPVRYRIIRVSDGTVLKTIYRGVHTGYDPDGDVLTLQIGGQATGRMSLREQKAPVFASKTDVLNLMRRVFQSINVPFDDDRNPTGIELGRFGDTGMLDYAQQVLARSWNRAGTQFTVMPDDDGVYRLFRRNTETIHGTIYLDDARTSSSLHRDISEEPNAVYVRGTTPEGRRFKNGVYPGLMVLNPAPEYPFGDNSRFGVGTTNADTDEGDGISVLAARLQTLGYLTRNDADDADGTYTQDIADAVQEVQEEAQTIIAPEFLGDMTTATWDDLFNVGDVGYSVWWSKIEPVAWDRRLRRWKRTADGAIRGKNPTFDKHMLRVDKTLEPGAGFDVRQQRNFAHLEFEAARDPNWAGTVTLGLGAIVRGDHTPGDAIDAADVMADWELDPGQNYKIVNSAGGELVVHCSGITYGEQPTTLTVDTRFRDAMPVWEVIRRNAESRGDLNRKANGQRRASTEVKDVLAEFEEYGGRIEKQVIERTTWANFPVVMGKAGQINEVRLRTLNAATRFVLCISGIEIPPAYLTAHVANPLLSKSGWYDEDFRDRLREEFRMWYIIGEPGALGGYWPKVQTVSGAAITGKWRDESPWSFETGVQPIGHVSIFTQDDCTVAGGRILWNQEIVGS